MGTRNQISIKPGDLIYNQIKKIFLIFIVSFFLSASGFGDSIGPRTEVVDLDKYQQIRYVDIASGTDEVWPIAGIPTNPWKTISYAVDQINDATPQNQYALFVAEGDYVGGIVGKFYISYFGGFDASDWSREISQNITRIDGTSLSSGIVIYNSHLDGFYITRYSANGRGVYAYTNCEISNNVIYGNIKGTNMYGAGIYVAGSYSSMIRNNCIFENVAGMGGDSANKLNGGGGIYNAGDPLVVKDNLIFSNNTNMDGNAVYSSSSIFLHKNIILDNNKGGEYGHASAVYSGNCLAMNNLFLFNKSSSYNNSPKGALNLSTGIVENNTFRGNRTWNRYGSIVHGITGGTFPIVKNNILDDWDGGSEISGPTDVSYSNIKGGFIGPGAGIIDTTPEFCPDIIGQATSISYDNSRVLTTLTDLSLTLKANEWKNFPIKVEDKYAIIYSNSENSIVVWSNVYSAPPVNWTIYDCRLAYNSPCIESGTNVVDVTNDFEFEFRGADAVNTDNDFDPLTGGIHDMGYDEYWEHDPPIFDGLKHQVPLGGGTIYLTWEPAIDLHAVRYLIYEATGTGAQNFSSPTYITQATDYLVTGKNPNQWYYYVVRAQDIFANTDDNKLEFSIRPSTLFQKAFEGKWNDQYFTGLYGGGSEQAHPAFADIDGDQDKDLFIGKKDGTVTYWQNNGSSLSNVWSNPQEFYMGIQYGSDAAPAFGDLDQDGDLDLLVGETEGTLAFYENIGSEILPNFTLNQIDYASIDVWLFSAPTLGDLDHDGDLDLLVGSLDGTLTYCENLGGGSWDLPIANYENIQVSALSSPSLIDIDGDMDLDLILGDINGSLTLFENTGTVNSPQWGTGTPDWLGINTGHDSAPALSAGYHETLMDLVLGNRQGKVFHYQVTETSLVPLRSSFGMIDRGRRSNFTFGDIDNDGDLDILTGGADGQLVLYENLNGGTVSDWENPLKNYADIDVGSFSAPFLADLNNDQKLDLMIGSYYGTLEYYINEGTLEEPVFNLSSSFFANVDVGYYSSPSLFDVEEDGDLDLLVGAYDGTVTFCENIGSAEDPHWNAPVTNYFSIDVGSYSFPAVGDVDNDSLPDLLIGNQNGNLEVYYNSGYAGNPDWSEGFSPYGNIVVGTHSAPVFSDIDLDGDEDLFVGEEDGGVNFWRNMTEHLQILPRAKTIQPEFQIGFEVFNVTETVSWNLLRNQSGGVISATGLYTAGSIGGRSVFDIIEASDNLGYVGRVRVNVIRPEDFLTSGKAIICAGRKGPFDSVWPATNYLTQLAYKTLLLKGYDKDHIKFLSPVVLQDVDENGDNTDDIDAEATLSNLHAAINWASDAEELVVYCADHGWQESGQGRFRINEGSENVLTALQLDGWLDNIQSGTNMKVSVIIDSCNSGSFLPYMIPPSGKERITITSCGEDELTYFLSGGLVSFSEAFWTSVYSGFNVGESFQIAFSALSPFQTSQIDDDGDGVYLPAEDGNLALNTEIGIKEIALADRPQIGWLMQDRTISSATSIVLQAGEISASYSIDKVWAVIVSPDFEVDPETSEPILDVTTEELLFNDSTQIWEATHEGFLQSGTYKIIFYARDIYNSVSLPKQVYIHKMDFTEKAVLVVGEDVYGPGEPWKNSNFLGNYAYQTFLNRWFGKDDIFYFNPLTNQDVDGNGWEDDVDHSPDLTLIGNTIINDCSNADKLTIYMIGQGATDTLKINSTENLISTQLDNWLDTLQTSTDTEVYVVLECKGSGTFADDLIAPSGKERILITSAAPGYDSYCDAGGIFSFSQFFLGRIYEGDDIRKAFVYGQPAISYISRGRQVPGLAADGNAIMNEKQDGLLSKNKYIGPGFLTGGDDLPTILEVAEDVFLTSGEVTSTVWCSGVFDSDGIKNVTAEIVPPDWPVSSITELPLNYNDDNNRYDETYSQFTKPGDYRILYTAEDGEGNISGEKTGIVYQYTTADIYEVDDTTEEASLIVVDWGESQKHNFHDYGDTDWAWFLALPESSYTINAGTPAITADLVLTLYHESDWSVPYIEVDSGYDGDPESYVLDVTAENQGVYYVNVHNYYPGDYGAGISYELEVNKEYGLENGWATPLSATQMLVTWSPSENGDLQGFQIFRSLKYNKDYVEVANPVSSVTEYLDEGLIPATTYYYQIYEVDTGFQKRYLTQPFFNTTFEETLTVGVQITSTTPETSQVLTIGEIFNIESMISYLSNEEGLNLLISLWNDTGSFESLPLVPLVNDPAWQEYSASFNNVLILDNGDVVLKAQVLNDSPTPTVLAEDYKTFPVATPTPITLSAPFWKKYR